MLKKLVLAVAATWSCSAFALVAPWYQYSNKLTAFLSQDSCLTIDFPPRELEPEAREEPVIAVSVKACSLEKAAALAKLLRERDAEWRVKVDIIGPQGERVEEGAAESPTLENLHETLDTAVGGHPLFKGTVVHKSNFGTRQLFAEFLPSVVQWYMDDISDLYGFHSDVAAKVADDLFNLNAFRELGLLVHTTTAVAELN